MPWLTNGDKTMRVRAYWNLNKKIWSILDFEPGSQSYGKLLGYAEHVLLGDVEFIVQPAGRRRTRAKQRKTVHAFAQGELLMCSCETRMHDEGLNGRELVPSPWEWRSDPHHLREKVADVRDNGIAVTYNPYEGEDTDKGSFKLKDSYWGHVNEPHYVTKAWHARLSINYNGGRIRPVLLTLGSS